MGNSATLISALADLAWPVVALVAVVAFRTQIRGLLRSISRLRAGPVEVGFWERQLREVRVGVASGDASSAPASESTVTELEPTSLTDELGEFATTSPVAAVVQAHDRVRDVLRAVLADAGAPGPLRDADSAVTLAAAAARRGLITNQTMFAAEGLTTLRNLTVHGDAEVTPDRARGYLVTADAVLYAIRQNIRTARSAA